MKPDRGELKIKKKLKTLLPSLKEKKRYLVFQILSKRKIKGSKAVKDEIEHSMLSLVGQMGMAKAGLTFMDSRYDESHQRGLIKVNNKYVDELKLSLALIHKMQQQEVMVKSVGVSGTIKKATEKYTAS